MSVVTREITVAATTGTTYNVESTTYSSRDVSPFSVLRSPFSGLPGQEGQS
jgi:hypothetical protein